MRIKVGLVLVAFSAVASAAPFTNGSFEIGPATGSLVILPAGNTSITGWTVGGSAVDYIGTYWQAQDGSRSLDMSARTIGTISQTFDTILNRVYWVNFWLAGNPDGSSIKTLRVSAANNQQDYTFNTTGKTWSAMGWVEHQFIFTAASTSTTLKFASLNASPQGPALDDVSVTADEAQMVPEPGTWLLLSGGLMLIGLRRKAIRKS